MRHAAPLFFIVVALAMGTGAILGLTGRAEPFLWALWSIAGAGIVLRTHPDHPVRYAFVAALPVMLSSFIAAAGFDLYLHNNPRFAARFAQVPAGISPRVLLACMGLVTAPIFATVTAAMTWLASKLTQHSRTA